MMLTRRYEMEAAHQLTAGVPEGHQCRRLHGHRYLMQVQIHGDIAEETGMVLEYAEVDAAVMPVVQMMDHRCLNFLGFGAWIVPSPDPDTPASLQVGTECDRIHAIDLAASVRRNPTVENLAKWAYAEIKARFANIRTVGFLQPHLIRVRIEEDSRSVVEIDHA